MTALRTSTLTLTFALLTSGLALAGPPLFTDDAGTIDVGSVEIGIGGGYIYEKENDAGSTTKVNAHEAELTIGTGLYKNVGIGIAVPCLMSERVKTDSTLDSDENGFGDITAELKYAFVELGGVHLAIKPAITLPTGKDSLSDDHIQYGATLIATKEFSDGAYAIHANLGYERHTYQNDGDGRENLWSLSIAGEAEVAKGLFAVADFGLSSNVDPAASTLPAYALAGMRYELNDNLDLSAGMQFGLTSPADDLNFVYGATIKF
jgi:hypothetical protein